MGPFFNLFFLLFNIWFPTVQAATGGKYLKELCLFPIESRIEFFIVLPDDSLLLTSSTENSLYRFDPKTSKEPVVVRKFPGKTSLLGIAQLNPSTIALVAGGAKGSYYRRENAAPGTFAVYLISPSGRIKASFPIPEATLLKGLTTLPHSPNYLLICDAGLGVVWRLNIITGAVDQLLDIPLDYADTVDTTLNAIHVRGENLYWVDRNIGFLGRLQITSDGTPITEEPEIQVIGWPFRLYGDFLVRPNNTFFITSPSEDVVIKIGFNDSSREVYTTSNGYISVIPSVLNGDTLKNPYVNYPTALACANRKCDILYVVTAGSLSEEQPPNAPIDPANAVKRSQILKLDLNLAPPGLTFPDPNI